MYKIGITGSIGTGKTSIANIFALFKIPIFDADKEVKKILDKKETIKKLENIWPETIKNNHINKPRLRLIIFSNKREKKKLEQLLYPQLKIAKKKFEIKNYNKKILIYDVPLIYETKSEKEYDLIILANCDPELQRKRVLNRDKISNSLYKKIVKTQLSFNEKIKFEPKIMNTNNFKLITFFKIVLLLVRISIEIKIRK